jgi:hypothetical protein
VSLKSKVNRISKITKSKAQTFLLFHTEIPTEFLETQREFCTQEESSIALTCSLNRQNRIVTWKKSGLKLTDAEHFKQFTQGNVSTLEIVNTSLEDSGEYVAVFRNLEYALKLNVTG